MVTILNINFIFTLLKKVFKTPHFFAILFLKVFFIGTVKVLLDPRSSKGIDRNRHAIGNEAVVVARSYTGVLSYNLNRFGDTLLHREHTRHINVVVAVLHLKVLLTNKTTSESICQISIDCILPDQLVHKLLPRISLGVIYHILPTYHYVEIRKECERRSRTSPSVVKGRLERRDTKRQSSGIRNTL